MLGELLLCAAMALGAEEPKAAPAAPKTEKADAAQQADAELLDIERNIVHYTNQQRVRFGMASLEVDKDLMESARKHCEWMATSQRMVHTSQPVAENIAMGHPHSSDVVQGWMNSSGHRANILNRGHSRIGVAAYRAANGRIFWCQQFRR
jgi:uncharacterized protein YkwD